MICYCSLSSASSVLTIPPKSKSSFQVFYSCATLMICYLNGNRKVDVQVDCTGRCDCVRLLIMCYNVYHFLARSFSLKFKKYREVTNWFAFFSMLSSYCFLLTLNLAVDKFLSSNRPWPCTQSTRWKSWSHCRIKITIIHLRRCL